MKFSATGPMKATSYAKNQVSISMYEKGKSFIAAYYLLNKNNGHPQVSIHLLCQGIEIIMKSFLLMSDYDKYKNYIKRNIGHNVHKSVTDAIQEFNLKPIATEMSNELEGLTKYFKNHLLRYGSMMDILASPNQLPYSRTLRKLVASIKLADRELRKNA